MGPTTERIRVVVVDDSVVVRRLLSDVLQSDPEVEVVATSSNGRLGVDAVRRLRPDVVVMDIEMPVMTGIEAVREIRTTDRRTPIIMFSTLTERGARATFDALDAGATDYVTKPGQASAVGSGLEQVRVELLPRVRALAGRRPATAARPGAPAPRTAGPTGTARATTRATTLPDAASRLARAAQLGSAALSGGLRARPAPGSGGVPRSSRVPGRRPSLLAIGSSTGGPEALARVLGALPASLSVPVVVVQHMPAEFTQLLAERLDRTCAVHVQHAVDGEPLVAGTVVIARGGRHLEVVRDQGRLRARLTDAPPENFCRPAVDVMFRSVARVRRRRRARRRPHRHGLRRHGGGGRPGRRGRDLLGAGRGVLGGLGDARQPGRRRPGRRGPAAGRHRAGPGHGPPRGPGTGPPDHDRRCRPCLSPGHPRPPRRSP